MVDRYTALAAPASAQIEVLRSQFICELSPATSDDEAKTVWAETKARFRDARHHCLALVIGPDGALRRSSDDGEPSGTAGAPMLDVLEGSGIRDVVAVVTRWFGGTLLGTGGLIRAYSDAVRAGLEVATTHERQLLQEQRLVVPVSDAGALEAELRRRGFVVSDAQWAAEVTYTVAAEPLLAASLSPLLAALTAGRVSAEPAGERWVTVS